MRLLKVHYNNTMVTLEDIVFNFQIKRIEPCVQHIVWSRLSRNPCVNMRIVKHFIGKPWSFNHLSSNSGMQIEDMLANLHLPWSFYSMSFNNNLRFHHIDQHPHLPWEYIGMSDNPSIKVEDIEQRKNVPWYRDNIIENPVIPLSYKIEKYGMDYVCENAYLLSDVQLTIDDFKAFAKHTYDTRTWYDLSCNRYVTESMVRQCPSLPWSANGLRDNPNGMHDVTGTQCSKTNDVQHCTLEYIDQHLKDLIDTYTGYFYDEVVMQLSNNTNCDASFLLKHFDRFKHDYEVWDLLSSVHLDIVHDDIVGFANTVIEKLLCHKKCYGSICSKCTRLQTKKVWENICDNPSFLAVNDVDIINEARRHLMSSRIKRYFKKSISDPSYALCRRRLIQEFNSFAREV